MGAKNQAGWYYGTGGYDGEPDATGPLWCDSRAEADGSIGVNYDVEGPFDSHEEAEVSLVKWLNDARGEEP